MKKIQNMTKKQNESVEEMVASNYLGDIENQKVTQFLNDGVMKNAVKKVMLREIYEQGCMSAGVEPGLSTKNWAMSFGHSTPGVTDQMLGQNLRAYAWALNSLEAAFMKLENMRVEAPAQPKDSPNPAI